MRSSESNNTFDSSVVEAQLRRMPRSPWRVGARCVHGHPTVIVSPSVLEDGARFPNWGYLTCPFLCSVISDLESQGAVKEWAARLENEQRLAENQYALEEILKNKRLQESQRCGQKADVCAEVGIAGQRNTLGVKCLHIHVAYALLGLNDAIGREILRDLTDASGGGCSCRDAYEFACGKAVEELYAQGDDEGCVHA